LGLSIDWNGSVPAEGHGVLKKLVLFKPIWYRQALQNKCKRIFSLLYSTTPNATNNDSHYHTCPVPA
jgi:hypothetical protein